MGAFLALTTQLSLIMSMVFIGYVVLIVVPYLRRSPGRTGDPSMFDWHFLVPCRDEEHVIGATIDYLRGAFPQAQVWVVDDDSDDGTGAVVAQRALTDDRVHLVQRRRPLARTGKGDALNSVCARLLEHLGDDADLDKVIVAVVDADGRPAANCLDVCAGPSLFATSEVGAVQIEVRMLNRDDRTPEPGKGRIANAFGRTLVRMQDIEFRTAISAIQGARRRTGTVGMGGNGQFSRLSALKALDSGDGRGVWRGSLLEDFELGIHVLLAGWKSEYTSDTWVDQEALFDARRYLTQRTRWSQGLMQCGRYWRAVWSSNQIPNVGLVEMSYFMFQPWLTLLGTLIYPIPFVALLLRLLSDPSLTTALPSVQSAVLLALYLVTGLGPFVIWGPIYVARCEPGHSRWAGLGWGLAYVVYVASVYLTTWRALARLLTGRSGWAKTRRNVEARVPGSVATEA